MVQGELTISARTDGEWVDRAVRDNGRGIPAESLKKLFEPF